VTRVLAAPGRRHFCPLQMVGQLGLRGARGRGRPERPLQAEGLPHDLCCRRGRLRVCATGCLLSCLCLQAATTETFDHISKQAADARVANRIQDATGLYREAVKMRPSWAEGWWFLGELLYDEDKYADARDALRHLVSLDPKAGPGFALLGLCEYETKEYARALDHINAGRRLGLGEDPQARRVVLYHAVLLLTKFQQYESALQVLDRVLRAGEATPAVIEAAGLAGLHRPILPEQMPGADKDLVERAGRAVCAGAGHEPAQAQKYFAELLANYPNTPSVHYLYGSYLVATDEDGGMREFLKELEVNPKNTEALVTVALEYERRGEPATAIPYARRGVETDPQFFAAHGVLGRLLANSGEVEKGIAELEIARKLAPDSQQVHFSLAAAYTLAGRKEDAARERAEFVRLKKLSDEMTGK
jgi:tetratricopeptide (TPR) repeat protein